MATPSLAPHSVADIMATKLHTLRPEQDIHDAVSLFLEHKISGAPVVDEAGCLVGVLSEKDCMRILLGSYFEEDMPHAGTSVRDFMTTEVRTIPSRTSITEVATLFHESPYRRLPVVDGTRLVGQVSRRDVLRAIHQRLETHRAPARPQDLGSMITESGGGDPVGPQANVTFQRKFEGRA